MSKRERSIHERATPSYSRLRPASGRATKAAAASSLKQGTRCELALREALIRQGLAFRTNVTSLPGAPDFVFEQGPLVVFADGDFWHGRNLKERIARLARGHNSIYWVRKIQTNVARDRRIASRLRRAGWSVMRVWESDIQKNSAAVARRIARRLARVQRERASLSGDVTQPPVPSG